MAKNIEKPASYKTVTVDYTKYRWTDSKNNDGTGNVLVDGQAEPVWFDYGLDGGEGFYIETDRGTFEDCEGVCEDGHALLEGKDKETGKKVCFRVDYPTLKEIYQDRKLLDQFLYYSRDLGELVPRVKSPYDVLMGVDTPIKAVLKGEDGYEG